MSVELLTKIDAAEIQGSKPRIRVMILTCNSDSIS